VTCSIPAKHHLTFYPMPQFTGTGASQFITGQFALSTLAPPLVRLQILPFVFPALGGTRGFTATLTSRSAMGRYGSLRFFLLDGHRRCSVPTGSHASIRRPPLDFWKTWQQGSPFLVKTGPVDQYKHNTLKSVVREGHVPLVFPGGAVPADGWRVTVLRGATSDSHFLPANICTFRWCGPPPRGADETSSVVVTTDCCQPSPRTRLTIAVKGTDYSYSARSS